MAAYVNLHAGVGKPLWEITVGEYSIWFKVSAKERGGLHLSDKNPLQNNLKDPKERGGLARQTAHQKNQLTQKPPRA